MSKKKKYEAVYINPNFCDGFWDNEETKYLEEDEIKEKIYENLENEEIEKILNRKEEKTEEKENGEEVMSGFKLALEGLGLLLYGIASLAWVIIKLVSCVFIAGLISTKLGLIGNYWWFGSIVIFAILGKIILLGNTTKTYSNLVDNYNEKIE